MASDFTDMIKKLGKTLLDGMVIRELDPTKFGNPIAAKTDWKPLKSGGANFKTKTLKKIDSNRIEFRASLGFIIFASIFILMGSSFFLLAATNISSGDFSNLHFNANFNPILCMPLIFPVVGILMLKFGGKTIYFDHESNSFGRGSKGSEKHECSLNDIAAIQLLAERVRTKNGSYQSYEFNLILTDGRRLNVLDHGHLATVRADIAEVQKFLGRSIPLFDATLPEYYVEKKLAS